MLYLGFFVVNSRTNFLVWVHVPLEYNRLLSWIIYAALSAINSELKRQSGSWLIFLFDDRRLLMENVDNVCKFGL